MSPAGVLAHRLMWRPRRWPGSAPAQGMRGPRVRGGRSHTAEGLRHERDHRQTSALGRQTTLGLMSTGAGSWVAENRLRAAGQGMMLTSRGGFAMTRAGKAPPRASWTLGDARAISVAAFSEMSRSTSIRSFNLDRKSVV